MGLNLLSALAQNPTQVGLLRGCGPRVGSLECLRISL